MEREPQVSVDPYLSRLAERMSIDLGFEAGAAQFNEKRPIFLVARELRQAAIERVSTRQV